MLYLSVMRQVATEEQRRLQWELFEVQKKNEAWGLVIPMLNHSDVNVQFFGAHTAQVKIVRDWNSFPKENAALLKDLLIDLTATSIITRKSKVILRKLYVALCHLALKLHPTRPSQWPNWIVDTVTLFSGRGAPPDQLLDFLGIIPEEIRSSELSSSTKMIMNDSLSKAVPMVLQAVTHSATSQMNSSNEVQSALKCLEKWIAWGLPADDLTSTIPMLLSLLRFEPSFIPASDVLQEILSSSSLSDGSGKKVLTDPLLDFLVTQGAAIYEQSLARGLALLKQTKGFIGEISHSLCKLLCALGDHSAMHFSASLSSLPTQNFIRLMLGYTGFPGWFGVDEEDSELCLAFWYLLQESLWSVDFANDVEADENKSQLIEVEEKEMQIANEIYTQLVGVLKRKITWPPKAILSQWSKDQVDRFAQYRRDAGDMLVNAYYILRVKMLDSLVAEVISGLAITHPQGEGWETIEATLHCIISIHEAVPPEPNTPLSRLFSATVFQKIASSGVERVKRTTLQLIGTYSSWFTSLPRSSPALMDAVSFIINSLNEPALCFVSANSLKELCDANRTALAPHIAAFGNLHAGISAIPETEKSKVLQSIASVIEAIPPSEAIQPVEVALLPVLHETIFIILQAIVNPIVFKLMEAITLADRLPEDARELCIQQIKALTGCARGLTSASESFFVLEETEADQAQLAAKMNAAREDPRMVRLRQDLLVGLGRAMQLWSVDVEVADNFSELFKAITSLPADATLISLPASPLLELTCSAAQRRLTGVWLSLASMLMGQLNPPSLNTLSLGPPPEAEALVLSALPALLYPCFQLLSDIQAMEATYALDKVALHFVRTLYRLPETVFATLIQTAIAALAIQERYALVSACSFLTGFLRQTLADGTLTEQADAFMNRHGKAIIHALLSDFVAVAPRSALPNLIDLLAMIILKRTDETRVWMKEILFSDYFVPCQATPEGKEKFLKSVTSARSTKKIRDASHEFALLARGLQGSSFGYATITV
ncbi:hypothetical protein Clacol_003285 [Clathrus columnatus]|uniref:Exportin-1/Importin-beta-like domain-containing protein n=1 Tax=Clathrus columnatus TaxID=1419009 RepID=A0AAV5A6G1_9AGAM|nr:hypothetical protein Clacol_003285 [Clathrus columnatus]